MITYPANRQDIAVVVAEDVEAGAIVAAAHEAGGAELREARVFDVYRGDQVGDGRKSVALHLVFQAPDRTLTDDDVAALARPDRRGARRALRRRAPSMTREIRSGVGRVVSGMRRCARIARRGLVAAASRRRGRRRGADEALRVGRARVHDLARDAQGHARDARSAAASSSSTVDDRSDEHNFHLQRPGRRRRDRVEEIGSRRSRSRSPTGATRSSATRTRCRCAGAFTVGAAPPPAAATATAAATPPPSPPKPSAPVGSTLTLTVGPGFTISLKTRAGRKVTLLRPGATRVRCATGRRPQRAAARRRRRRGRPASAFVGTQTWRVVLRKGTLVIQCDPHKATMRQTVRVA